MKKNKLILIISFLILFISISCQRSIDSTAGFNIMKGLFVPEKDTFRFKLVEIGDSIVFKINYKNKGTEPFRINNIGIGCDCTTARWDSSYIKPNESNYIEVIYRNKSDDNSILRTLVVETNTSKRLHVIYLKGLKNDEHL